MNDEKKRKISDEKKDCKECRKKHLLTYYLVSGSMKFWFDKGSSHSANYCVIYVFDKKESAELFTEHLKKLIDYFSREYDKGIFKFFEELGISREEFARKLAERSFLVEIGAEDVNEVAKSYLNGLWGIVDWEDPPEFGISENVVTICVYTDGKIEVFDILLEILGLKNRVKEIVISSIDEPQEIAEQIRKLIEQIKEEICII